MLRFIVGLSAALLTGPAWANAEAMGPAWQWGNAQASDGGAIARINVDQKMLVLKCVGAAARGHELVYEVPTRLLRDEFTILKPKQADLVMWVDGHGGFENDRVTSAKVAVSTHLGSHLFTLSGPDAWAMQSAIATSDWVTIAVNADYAASPLKNYGVTSYRTSGTAETAMRDVLTQCAPK